MSRDVVLNLVLEGESRQEGGDGHCADGSPGLRHAGSLPLVLPPRMLCWLQPPPPACMDVPCRSQHRSGKASAALGPAIPLVSAWMCELGIPTHIPQR